MDNTPSAAKLISTGITVSNPLASFLWKNKKLIALVIILLSISGLIGYQFINIKIKNVQISLLKTQIATLKNEVEFHKNEVINCKANYKDLSESIKSISKTSLDIQRKMDSIVPAISQIKKDTGIVIDDINNEPDPTTCEQAMDFLSRWYK